MPESCGCQIAKDQIVYCPKHKAVREMYEALLMVREELVFGGDWETARNKINKVLAKAEGK